MATSSSATSSFLIPLSLTVEIGSSRNQPVPNCEGLEYKRPTIRQNLELRSDRVLQKSLTARRVSVALRLNGDADTFHLRPFSPRALPPAAIAAYGSFQLAGSASISVEVTR